MCFGWRSAGGVAGAAQVRKGYHDGGDSSHTWLPRAAQWGAAAATVHGRTRQQRCGRSRWHPLSCSLAPGDGHVLLMVPSVMLLST